MVDLIEQLITSKYLKTSRLIKAFKKIKREDFVLPGEKQESELNVPLNIGFGQTISQPLTVAFMLELLRPQKGDNALDVGSGSAWVSALLAEIAGKDGRVYAIERIEELKNFGEQNAEKYKFVSEGRLKFFAGDGAKGLPKYAPFDVIHVGASAAAIPTALLEQLAIGGRLIIPEGVDIQELVLIERQSQKEYTQRRFSGFVFVPLISETINR